MQTTPMFLVTLFVTGLSALNAQAQIASQNETVSIVADLLADGIDLNNSNVKLIYMNDDMLAVLTPSGDEFEAVLYYADFMVASGTLRELDQVSSASLHFELTTDNTLYPITLRGSPAREGYVIEVGDGAPIETGELLVHHSSEAGGGSAPNGSIGVGSGGSSKFPGGACAIENAQVTSTAPHFYFFSVDSAQQGDGEDVLQTSSEVCRCCGTSPAGGCTDQGCDDTDECGTDPGSAFCEWTNTGGGAEISFLLVMLASAVLIKLGGRWTGRHVSC